MKIATHITEGAKNILQFEGVAGLPKEIGKSGFFVAEVSDGGILGHGSIFHDSIEYKIGTKKK